MKRHLIKKKSKQKVSLPKDFNVSSWKEPFKGLLEKRSEAGAMLKGLRSREDLSQENLAKALGTNQSNISNMEIGNRPIGKGMAKRLSKIFNIDYRVFL